MLSRVDAADTLQLLANAVPLLSVVSQFPLLFFAAPRCIVAKLLLWLGVVAFIATLDSVALLYPATISRVKNRHTAAAVSCETLPF